MSVLTSAANALTGDPGYRPLKDHVISNTGLAYYGPKDDEFSAHLLSRMQSRRVNDCHTYLTLLRDPKVGEAELDRLVEMLTIGETSFYRHVELFDGLRERVIPELIQRNLGSRRLRIWSAGCSIGAEPYSVAILLLREFESQLKGWDVSILGTDINRRYLAQAREGRFRNWEFRNCPAWLVDECTIATDDEPRLIRPEYRQWVRLPYHNLVRHPFPSLVHNLIGFDLILCRNVVIYFDAPIAARLVEQFYECLSDRGWLLVGPSEPNVELFRAFRCVNVPGAVLYQRSDATRPEPSSFARPTNPPGVTGHTVGRSTRAPSSPPRHGRGEGRHPHIATVRSLADAGCLTQAAALCETLHDRHPGEPSYAFYLAMLMAQVGDSARMERYLDDAIRADGGFLLAHYYLVEVHHRNGRHREALALNERVSRLLEGLDGRSRIPEGDELTVADLRELTRMQLETLGTP